VRPRSPFAAARLALALAASLAAASCAPDPAALARAGGVSFDRVGLLEGAAPAPPPDTEPGWREVELPDVWSLPRRIRATEGWYRVDFDATTRSEEPWAVSVVGAWTRLSLSVNDRPVAEWNAADVAGTAGGPGLLYTRIPRGALRDGANRIALHFSIAPASIGFLSNLELGPAHLVGPNYRREVLIHATLPFVFTLFGLASGALVLALSRWDASGAARWFAAGTLFWSAGDLSPALRLPAGGWGDWAFATIGHAFVPCLAIGFHRALGLRRPRIERVFVASVAIGAAARALVAPVLIPFVDNLWWLLYTGIGAYLVPLAVGNWRRSELTPGWLVLGATLFVLAAGVHDLASLIHGAPLFGLALFGVARPLIGLTTAAVLVSMLGRALATTEQINVELERRVEEKRSELAASYERVAELERARTLAAERERLMRDMHDGTGGQLVSALAMVEAGGFTRDAVAEALRDALADLRLTIDSLDPEQPDLVPLLGMARARLEPRLEPSGMRFEWDVRDVARPEGFGPHAALQVLRVFQEAVTNALRHTKATTLVVRTGEERDAAGRACAFVEVADDGQGFEVGAGGSAGGGGRGLRNMRRRAAELGGELLVASGMQGTSVKLRIPL
jgi:signal transduction histidine kinase